MLDTTPEARAAATLEALGAALEDGDVDAALARFATDCYWRDLVSFTWNIRTFEGKAQIRDMLEARLADTAPTGFALLPGEPVTEEAGIVTAWFSFETGVARGSGIMRLNDGGIWTLLTTMAELKGHEEPQGFARPLGANNCPDARLGNNSLSDWVVTFSFMKNEGTNAS